MSKKQLDELLGVENFTPLTDKLESIKGGVRQQTQNGPIVRRLVRHIVVK